MKSGLIVISDKFWQLVNLSGTADMFIRLKDRVT